MNNHRTTSETTAAAPTAAQATVGFTAAKSEMPALPQPQFARRRLAIDATDQNNCS